MSSHVRQWTETHTAIITIKCRMSYISESTKHLLEQQFSIFFLVLKFLHILKKLLRTPIINSLHINTNNYISNKNEKTGIALWFCKTLYVQLNRRQLDPHFCFCIQCDVIYDFGWSTWRKPMSHRYAVGKGKDIVVVFLDNWGYSSLILHQNSISLVAK